MNTFVKGLFTLFSGFTCPPSSYLSLVHKKIKSSLYSGYYTEAITSGGVHLRGIAPRQHRNVTAVASASDLTGPVIEPKTSRGDRPTDDFNHYVNRPVAQCLVNIQLYSKLHPPTEIFWIRSCSGLFTSRAICCRFKFHPIFDKRIFEGNIFQEV